jgi:penicillin amidase
MKRLFKVLFVLLMVLLTVAAIALAAGVWHARSKLPQRSGSLALEGLRAPVQVNWDERGVPHLQAQSEADLYRALGFLHAQDRLFQMEMMRRLARGELAEILGANLVDTDRLFRTLELRAHAEESVQRIDFKGPSGQALQAYLDGINEFQDTRPLPLEFGLLGIQPQPYTAVDTLAVAGYLAYSFAAGLRTEPVLTYVRDQLGPDYLRVFDLDWYPLGVVGPMAQSRGPAPLAQADWQALARVAEVSQQALGLAGVPLFEGSNAWAISGRRTASGKPLLAGDPHISFALPAVWYEAHLKAPGFELYGHFLGLNPFALLGHNQDFGWSLTMFQNDDMDLVALRANPANPRQVAYRGQWVDLRRREELIQVKDGEPVSLTLQRSPHGPLIHQVFPDSLGQSPVALWWTLLESENPVLDAF